MKQAKNRKVKRDHANRLFSPKKGHTVVQKKAPARRGRAPGRAVAPARKSRGTTFHTGQALPDTDTPDATLLTIDQTSRVLNVSDWYARKLIRDKRLPAVELAHNCVRVQLGDLRAFIESCRTKR